MRLLDRREEREALDRVLATARAGTEGRAAGPAPGHADYGSFASFSDPGSNGWLLQEVKTRAPGR
jgi:hypothetical protein